MLQRCLVSTDRNLWRTVLRFTPRDEKRITDALKLMGDLDMVRWRVVQDGANHPVVATWNRERARWDLA